MGVRCLSGELDHLVPAGFVGPATALVFTAEYAGLLFTERAGAGEGMEELGYRQLRSGEKWDRRFHE